MYESPINVFQMIENETQRIIKEIHTQEENTIMAEITRRMGVDVDKQELIRALNYDRNQYEKGYIDGKNASFLEELEKIKAKINDLKKAHHIWLIDQNDLIDECSQIIDNHISKLKGEQNGR